MELLVLAYHLLVFATLAIWYMYLLRTYCGPLLVPKFERPRASWMRSLTYVEVAQLLYEVAQLQYEVAQLFHGVDLMKYLSDCIKLLSDLYGV